MSMQAENRISAVSNGRLSKQGNGTALLISKAMLEASGLRQGEDVIVTATPDEITVRRADADSERARVAVDDVFQRYGPALKKLAE